MPLDLFMDLMSIIDADPSDWIDFLFDPEDILYPMDETMFN